MLGVRAWKSFLAIVTVGMAAACATAPSEPDSAPDPGSADESDLATDLTLSSADGGWALEDAPRRPVRVEIGRSCRERPIEALDSGGDGPVVLVIGGIHGDEPTSAAVTGRLAGEVRSRAELTEGLRLVVLVRTNPDGLAAGTRVNARGVDLNRNFPARNWRRAPNRSLRRGATPASEPETRALLELIARLEPALIVSIHSIGGGRHCNNYDGPARHLAEAMTKHNGYPTRASIGYPTPGSLGSWAGVDRGIPTVTLELPRDVPGDLAWKNNRDALIEAIRSVTVPSGAPEGR